MTRVQIHDLDSTPQPSGDALKALDHKFGTTLNIFGAMANSPAVLNAFVAFEEAVAEHTSLDRKTREAIHLTVASVNECTYCQGAYTMAAKAAGFDDEQAMQIRRGALEGDEKVTALLVLVREIATSTASWTRSRTSRRSLPHRHRCGPKPHPRLQSCLAAEGQARGCGSCPRDDNRRTEPRGQQ